MAGFFVMAHLENLQQQLPQLYHHELPRGPVPMLGVPDLVIYPGTSSRRAAFFRRAFPEREFRNVAIGKEPGGDIADVMKFKLGQALPHIPENRCVAVIAADTQNVTPSLDRETGGVRMTSWPKPDNAEKVYRMFRDMVEFGDEMNQPPFYVGDSSSGMLHLNGSAHLVEDRRQSVVELYEPRFRQLADVRGFEEYLRQLDLFYGQELYAENGMRMGLKDLSAGISLPVLVKLGMVSSVDGVSVQDPMFRAKLLEGVHNVAVGISPGVLETVQVDKRGAIEEWPWLNGVVDSALC